MAAQKSFLAKTEINLPIDLEPGAEVLVKEGQFVGQDQLLAKNKQSWAKEINLSKELGVSGRKAIKLLIKKLGEGIKKGELIGQKKSLWGTRKAYSPLEGKLDSLSEEGILRISSFSETEVKSLFSGKLSQVSAKGMILNFPALELKGNWGIGGRGIGALKLFLTPSSKKEIFQISPDALGKILVFPGEISKALWFKLLSLGVAGVTAGSLSGQGLKQLLTDQESILAKEGKGRFPALVTLSEGEIEKEIWHELEKHEGKRVMIEGEKAKLTIPLES